MEPTAATSFTALANQNSTATTGLPSYLQPYFDRALNRAESAATEAYKPYTGQLTAGLSPLETQAGNNAAGLQTPGQFESAGNIYNQAAQGLMSLGGFQPGQLNNQYTAGQTTGGTFDNAAAQQYMNPYVQNVLDIQRREANTEFEKQQAALRGRLGAAGAFGGSRATLLETEAQRGQNQLLDDMQQKGLFSAYTNAQDQFERDRMARLNAFGMNESARQEQQRLQNQVFGANESARQGAADIGLRSMTGAANVAQGLGALGSTIGQDARANIGLQAEIGKQQRDQQQGGLDRQLQLFLDERGYPMEQAKTFSGILANLANGQRTQTNTGPELSTLDKILGYGAQGASLLNMIGGNQGAGAGLGSLISGGSSLINTVGNGLTSLFGNNGSFGGFLDSIFNPGDQASYESLLADAGAFGEYDGGLDSFFDWL